MEVIQIQVAQGVLMSFVVCCLKKVLYSKFEGWTVRKPGKIVVLRLVGELISQYFYVVRILFQDVTFFLELSV